MQNIIFINSHPIQYFVPMYQKIAADNRFDLTVLYCSDESIRGAMDHEFGVEVKWDIPLLKGYKSRFMKNFSWKPSIQKGFLGLINIGIISELYRRPKSTVVVHGWGYLTHVMSIIFAKLFGHTVCIRSESPYKQEIVKSKYNRLIKYLLLQCFLFKFIDHFLFIGEQNKKFYAFNGAPADRLHFTPYCVDNQRFREAFSQMNKNKAILRKNAKIAPDAKVILYVGKYIAKKRPIDLLRACAKINCQKKALIMVGEGELRNQMESIIQSEQISDVYLTGFINQSQISEYYAMADVFVMCSEEGETWGLSVNEAMNFHLPVIVSDLTGCADDLVVNGYNGYTFHTRNIQEMAEKLEMILSNPILSNQMGENSSQLISKYSYEVIIEVLWQIRMLKKPVQAT